MKHFKIYFLILFLLFPLAVDADAFEPHATYTVCFTPQEDCTQQIVVAINSAVRGIWVQAYAFTSRPIGKALVFAKERGVKVQMILDKSVLDHKNTLDYFTQHGVPVWVDTQVAGIAHNKVMIIDQTRVITGSFNFTYAAQNDNAENVLIIEDAGLAQKYLQNWQQREHVSELYALPTTPLWHPNWLERLWQQFLEWLKHVW